MLSTWCAMESKVVCAWCGKLLKDGKEPISHGICEPCAKKVLDGR